MTPRLIHSAEPTARKPHTCDVCLTTIEPGTKYQRAFLIYDDPYTFVNHMECGRVGQQSLDWFDDEGFTYESVSEWLYERRDDLTDKERIVWERIERGRAERRGEHE